MASHTATIKTKMIADSFILYTNNTHARPQVMENAIRRYRSVRDIVLATKYNNGSKDYRYQRHPD